ncbi:MAG: hypothetical protein LBU55_05240 [Elusimicrobiota bacterium]|jgi:tetratricopeptide (TPR) repeat protein|nr:hypothetical protein [Elusimicrobiota bacterium]
MLRKLLAWVLPIFLAVNGLFATDDFTYSTNPILMFNPNPVSSSMGGYGVSLMSENSFAVFSNPASSIGANRVVADLTLAQFPKAAATYNYIGFQFPTTLGNFGFSSIFSNFNENNFLNVHSGSASIYSLNYSLNFRKTVPLETFYGGIGISFKLIQELLEVNEHKLESATAAVDIGVIINLPNSENFSFGAVFRNLGASLKYESQEYQLPQFLSIGTVYSEENFFNLRAIIDYNYNTSKSDKQIYSSSDSFFSVGMQVSFIDNLSFRTGVKITESDGVSAFTLGFGVDMQDFTFNYAYVPFETASGTHNLSLSYSFGKFKSSKRAFAYYLLTHFRNAVNDYNRGDYISAKIGFKEILEVYPGHIASQSYIARIDRILDNVSAYAITKITKYLEEARNAAKSGDALQAMREYQMALDLDSSNYLAKNGIDEMKERGKEFLTDLRVRKNRKKIVDYYGKAAEAFKNKDYIRAKECLNVILNIDTNNESAKKAMSQVDRRLSKISSDKIDGIFRKAVKLFEIKNYQEALMYFESVLIASPDRKDVYEYITRCREKIKKLSKRKEMSTAEKVKAAKELLGKYLDYAVGYYEDGRLEEAVEYFRTIQELAEKYDLTNNFADSSYYLKEIEHKLSAIHYQKGVALANDGRVIEAAEEFVVALEYNPNNKDAKNKHEKISKLVAKKHYEIGMLLYNKGDYIRASQAFRLSLRYDPSKLEAKRMIERLQ